MEQTASISDYLEALRRRWLLIIAVTLVGAAASIGLAIILPPVYKSAAQIAVESQQIPTELARSTITSGAAERLQLIEQRLMTRENLLDIASRLGLYADRPGMTRSEVVERMRQATTFEPITVGNARRGPVTVSAFTISYRGDDPATVARVTNEFVTMVLDQNARTRTARVTETREFFQREVERLLTELIAIEDRIANFKNDNAIALPDSLEFRRSELENLRAREFDREKRRVTLEEERRALVDARAAGATSAPGRTLSPAEQELQRLNQLLVQKRARFSDAHPEIKLLQSQIRAVEASISPGAAEEGSDSSVPSGRLLLNRQIEIIDAELVVMAEEKAAAEARATELAESIERTPEVEMALSALERKYTELQDQYRDAVAKRSEAALGERLEVDRQAERFEVIEQAQVPTRRESPNRKLIAAGGSAGSLVLALGLALLIELTNQRIRTPRDLERQLELRPLVTIPYIETYGEWRSRIWRTRLIRIFFFGVIPVGLALVHYYYLPLDLLARQAVERLGIDEAIYQIERGLKG